MIIGNILLIVLGFVLLIKGADFLVDGASDIAKKFHIPQIIIGLTIVSIGTSLPELFVSLTSAINGSSDMAIGNVIGSNLANMFLILGLSSAIAPIEFKRETRLIEVPMLAFITVLFAIFCNTNGAISQIEGGVLLILLAVFIGYTIIMAKKGMQFDKEKGEKEPTKKELKKEAEEEKKINVLKSCIYIAIGIVALKFGGDFTVNNAVVIAERFGVSEKIIGLTILAVGTSLPELVTSVIAAIKGDSDIAIGNIIGSNVFNILGVIGATAAIRTLGYNNSYNIQFGFLFGAIAMLAIFPFIKPKNQMSRDNGIIYLIAYAAYMTLLFVI